MTCLRDGSECDCDELDDAEEIIAENNLTIGRLSRRNQVLEEAVRRLRAYARHSLSCTTIINFMRSGPCDCGYVEMDVEVSLLVTK